MKKLLLVSLLAAGSAFAEALDYLPRFTSESFFASASVSVLRGRAEEIQYQRAPGREWKKESQLIWKIKHLPVMKLDFKWDAYSFLTFNARGWVSLTSRGKAFMTDQDWLEYPGIPEIYLYSETPNTNVRYAYEFDLNTKLWMSPLENFKIGFTIGYQQDRFKWIGSGGRYSYINGTEVGEFPNVPMISYKQRYSTPYIGLAAQYRWKDFELNGVFKFSDWVTAKDRDDHLSRKITFLQKTNSMRFYGINLDAGYHVTDDGKLFVEFGLNKYKLARGDTVTLTPEGTEYGYNDAGMANWNYSISMGFNYRF